MPLGPLTSSSNLAGQKGIAVEKLATAAAVSAMVMMSGVMLIPESTNSATNLDATLIAGGVSRRCDVYL